LVISDDLGIKLEFGIKLGKVLQMMPQPARQGKLAGDSLPNQAQARWKNSTKFRQRIPSTSAAA
jgi:hypothetical protein